MRQVLLRGSWESVLSWHTWSPGSSVAWSGLGAWWRARGGWCEVLVLKTGVESNTGYFVVSMPDVQAGG